MDPVTHRRMRTAHLNHTIRCVCGRLLHGNGEKAHRRTCRQHLREAGWPLASSWIGTFVDAGYPGAETARKVEMGLGRWALEHESDREAHGHPRQPNQLGWAEFKALVWSLADSREGGGSVNSSDESPAVVELPDDAIGAMAVANRAVEDAPDDAILTVRDVVRVAVAAASPIVRTGALADERVAIVAELEAAGHLAAANLIAECAGPTFDERIAEAVAAERQWIADVVVQSLELGCPDAAAGVFTGHTLGCTCERCDRFRAALAAGSVPVATPPRPEIVVLCGSIRFKDAFRDAAKAEALAGRIVLTVSDLDPRPEARHVNVPIDDETKTRLDWLHKRKIDLADRAHFLNVGGYIGESTRSEMEYARDLGKAITFLEPDGASPVPAGQPEPRGVGGHAPGCEGWRPPTALGHGRSIPQRCEPGCPRAEQPEER